MTYNFDWLIQQWEAGPPLEFIFFWSHTSKHPDSVGPFIFSQWYPAAFKVNGIHYLTREH